MILSLIAHIFIKGIKDPGKLEGVREGAKEEGRGGKGGKKGRKKETEAYILQWEEM